MNFSKALTDYWPKKETFTPSGSYNTCFAVTVVIGKCTAYHMVVQKLDEVKNIQLRSVASSTLGVVIAAQPSS